MAFEASAELRETRGFISMTTTSPVARLRANWTLAPPVETPTARMTVMAASRSDWSSGSVSVITGATVTESPVWTPIGSMFSIEQTMTALSADVAHHLELDLRPPQHRALHQHLADRARGERAAQPVVELLGGVGRPAALAAERERRAQDDRQAQLGGRGPAAGQVGDDAAVRARPGPAAAIVSRKTSRSSARRIAGTSAPISSTP